MSSRVVEITFGCSYIVLSHSPSCWWCDFYVFFPFSSTMCIKVKWKDFKCWTWIKQSVVSSVCSVLCIQNFVFRHVNCMRSFALDMIYCWSTTRDNDDDNHHPNPQQTPCILWCRVHYSCHTRSHTVSMLCLSSTWLNFRPERVGNNILA